MAHYKLNNGQFSIDNTQLDSSMTAKVGGFTMPGWAPALGYDFSISSPKPWYGEVKDELLEKSFPKRITTGQDSAPETLVLLNGSVVINCIDAKAGKNGRVVSLVDGAEQVTTGDVLVIHTDVVNSILSAAGHDPLLDKNHTVMERLLGIVCNKCGKFPEQRGVTGVVTGCIPCAQKSLELAKPLWEQDPKDQFVCHPCNSVKHYSQLACSSIVDSIEVNCCTECAPKFSNKL